MVLFDITGNMVFLLDVHYKFSLIFFKGTYFEAKEVCSLKIFVCVRSIANTIY